MGAVSAAQAKASIPYSDADTKWSETDDQAQQRQNNRRMIVRPMELYNLIQTGLKIESGFCNGHVRYHCGPVSETGSAALCDTATAHLGDLQWLARSMQVNETETGLSNVASKYNTYDPDNNTSQSCVLTDTDLIAKCPGLEAHTFNHDLTPMTDVEEVKRASIEYIQSRSCCEVLDCKQIIEKFTTHLVEGILSGEELERLENCAYDSITVRQRAFKSLSGRVWNLYNTTQADPTKTTCLLP